MKNKKTIEAIAKTFIDIGKLTFAAFAIGGLLVEEKSLTRILLGGIVSIVLMGFGFFLIMLTEKENNNNENKNKEE